MAPVGRGSELLVIIAVVVIVIAAATGIFVFIRMQRSRAAARAISEGWHAIQFTVRVCVELSESLKKPTGGKGSVLGHYRGQNSN